MKKLHSVHRYQKEKAIIDALLKISDIIKQTTNINQYSRKTIDDIDKSYHTGEYDYNDVYDECISPRTRTSKAYVPDLHHSCRASTLKQLSNFNKAPMISCKSLLGSKLNFQCT